MFNENSCQTLTKMKNTIHKKILSSLSYILKYDNLAQSMFNYLNKFFSLFICEF